MWPFGWKMHGRRGLRMWTLSMIARSPKNGAEIVDEIEQMTQGWWRPSPGSIYPLLADLQQEGLIEKREDGRYALNPKVREEFDWMPGMGRSRPRGIPDMVSEMEGFASYFEDLKSSDASKLQPHREGIRKIAQRLLSIAEGGERA
ncbi:MAG TPA: PadR family transcriptional regulator [Thermoanaerobaculia bacterium]